MQNHHLEHIESFVMDVGKEYNCHSVTNNKVFKKDYFSLNDNMSFSFEPLSKWILNGYQFWILNGHYLVKEVGVGNLMRNFFLEKINNNRGINRLGGR